MYKWNQHSDILALEKKKKNRKHHGHVVQV